MFCENCGNELLENVNFCNQCGRPIEEKCGEEQKVWKNKKEYFKYHCSKKSKRTIKVMWLIFAISVVTWIIVMSLRAATYVGLWINLMSADNIGVKVGFNPITIIVAYIIAIIFVSIFRLFACLNKNLVLSIIDMVIASFIFTALVKDVISGANIIIIGATVAILNFISAIVVLLSVINLNKEYKANGKNEVVDDENK